MAAGDPADPIGALITFLNADTRVSALAANHIFGGELPDSENTGTVMPRQTILLADSGGASTLGGGYLPFGDQRIDVRCYGATLRDARTLYGAVLLTLKGLRPTVQGGTKIMWCRPGGGPMTFREPGTEWPCSFSAWQILAMQATVV